MKPYALILSHNRQKMARELADSLVLDGIETFIIDHASTPALEFYAPGVYIHRVEDLLGEDFNISTLWNLGLDWINRFHAHSGMREIPYCVTVLNDDTLLSPGFCQEMARLIEAEDVDIASAGSHLYVDQGRPHQISLGLRPQGWAWTVRGDSGIRVDESMRVWYSDDDLWQQALQGRGYALTSSVSTTNRDANGNFSRNPFWQEQAHRDRKTFVAKWKREPW